MEPSPYLPTTRRFVNPLYIRVEDIPEVGYVSAAERQLLEWHADDAHALNTDDVHRPRRRPGQAKRRRCDTVFQLPRAPRRERAFDGVRRARGRGAASTSRPGARSPRSTGCPGATGPTELHDPRSPAVAGGARRTWPTGRVPPVAAVGGRRAARVRRSGRRGDAGMAIGVDARPRRRRAPRGRRRLGPARRARPAASPSGPRPTRSTSMGQDWTQPPWRPDRLPGAGLRAVPRHAAHRPAPRRRHPGRPRHRPVPAVVGARGA